MSITQISKSLFNEVKSQAKAAWNLTKSLVAAGMIPDSAFAVYERKIIEMFKSGVALDGLAVINIISPKGETLEIWAQSISMPYLGMNFSAPKEMGWGVIATPSELEPVQVTYIDDATYGATKKLEALYLAQFGQDGLLKYDYNNLTIKVTCFSDDLKTTTAVSREYQGCAITRSKEAQLTQTKQVMLLSFSFQYKDYKINR